MDTNPYRPPSSNPNPNKPRKPGDRKPLFDWGWKFCFYGYSLLVSLALLSVPYLPTFGFFDLIDFLISVTATGALFGLGFRKRTGSVVFWRYFFYVALFESILFVIFLPLFGIPRYGRPYEFSLMEWLLTLFVLMALHQYAYRRRDIWLQP